MLGTIETLLKEKRQKEGGASYKSNGKDARTGVKIQFVPLVGQLKLLKAEREKLNTHCVSLYLILLLFSQFYIFPAAFNTYAPLYVGLVRCTVCFQFILPKCTPETHPPRWEFSPHSRPHHTYKLIVSA